MRTRILLMCLLLSGFTGLSYELLWVRLLTLSFGSTTLSFATVLAVFFGGLSLGAHLGGRYAARVRNPMRAYALLELGTGGVALVLYPALTSIEAVFVSLDPGTGLGGALVRAAVSAPLLLGPTILMGATLPIVTRAVVVDDGDVGRGSGYIYAVNTLGAFLGAYGVTYWLLPLFGVFASTLVTVGINVLVAVIAWVAAPRSPVAPPPPSAARDEEDEVDGRIRLIATGSAFLVGFAAICFQVAWARLTSIFLDGTIYGLGAVLMSVLVGIGIGALVVAPAAKGSRDVGLWFAAMQCLTLASVGLLTAHIDAVAYLARTLEESMQGTAGLHAQLVVVVLALLVPSVASGASFPLLVQLTERRAARAPRTFARLYTSNTIGSILGSLCTGFVLLPETGTVATLFLGVVIVGLVCATCAMLTSTTKSPVRYVFVILPLLLVSAFTGYDARVVSQAGRNSAKGKSYARFVRDLQRQAASSEFFHEGAVATVTIRGKGDVRSLALNGLGQGAWRRTPPHHIFESLLVGYVPLAYTPKRDKGLLVGLGAGVTADALLRFGVEDLTVVELEESVVDALPTVFFGGPTPLDDPRLTLVHGDARHHLARLRANEGGGFDFIASMPAHPWVASAIFTQEFFELARDNLAPTGVFSTWFGLTPGTAETASSLLRAFSNAFPNVIVHVVPEAGALYLVGSPSPLRIDMARMAALSKVDIVASSRIDGDPYFLTSRIALVSNGEGPFLRPGPVNTDDSAFVEVQTPRTSTVTSYQLEGYFQRFGFEPDALEPAAARPEHALEIMERYLGTPNGAVPLQPQRPVSVPRLRATLARLAPAFDEATQAYLRGRIDLVSKKRQDARATFTSVPAEHPIAARARRFVPNTYDRGSAARAEAWSSAPAHGSVWAQWLDEDPEAAKAGLQSVSAAPPEDPLAALVLEVVRPAETATLSKAAFATHAERLLEAQNLGLVEAAHAYTVRRGWDDIALNLEPRRLALRRRRASTLAAQGRAAGQRGQFAAAADKLEAALALHPVNQKAQRLLIIALVEAGDPARLAATEQRFAFLGWSRTAFRAVVEDAERGKSAGAFERSEPLEAEAAEPEMKAEDALPGTGQ